VGKRIFVTGAAGFIGSHLIERLTKDPSTIVVGIDSLEDYYSVGLKSERLKLLESHHNFHFRNLNLNDVSSLSSLFQEFQPEGVYHLAAQAGVRLGPKHLSRYFDSNVTGFASIFSKSLEFGVSDFLYASSSSVYGRNATVPFSESDESATPESLYGWTKWLNEQTVGGIRFKNEYSMRARGLRFFTVYGHLGRPDMAYFRVLTSLLTGSTFRIFGDANVARDFTFIDDVVRISVELGNQIATEPPGFVDVVNVGGGRPVSLAEYISMSEQIVGRSLNLLETDGFRDDLPLTHASNRYLNGLLGTQSFVKLEEALTRMLPWFEKNARQLDDWVDSVRS
jgi:UDP-glucuronate 4-epimerase